MTDFDSLDFESILDNIKPNVVTPKLTDVLDVSNTKKPRVIADIIVRSMHASLDNPVTKDIIHDGQIHKIRYFDIEPLMTGVWSEVSLMILHLSYGEQVAIIDAIYPKSAQLTAKAFAINFTPDVKTTDIRIENDTELIDKLDSANAGIATIIALIKRNAVADGGKRAEIHPDNIKKEMSGMKTLVENQREAEAFKAATERATSAAKHGDTMGRM